MGRRFLRLVYKILTWPDRALRWAIARVLSGTVSTARFGLREALVFSSSVDIWQRYAVIAETIQHRSAEKLSILDIGAGGPGIARFLERQHYDICVLDYDIARFISCGSRRPLRTVVADACVLPFGPDSFDIVVSSDNLEHILPQRRADYYRECQRVAKRMVLMHVPVTDELGNFRGDFYDKKFQEIYRRITGGDEFNIAEHIQNGLPSVSELRVVFPSSRLCGWQNGDLWLRYMLVERIPYVRLLTGLFYLLFLQKTDRKPPFYSCFLHWEKPCSWGTSL